MSNCIISVKPYLTLNGNGRFISLAEAVADFFFFEFTRQVTSRIIDNDVNEKFTQQVLSRIRDDYVLGQWPSPSHLQVVDLNQLLQEWQSIPQSTPENFCLVHETTVPFLHSGKWTSYITISP